jgi:hypothetical protein
MKCFCSCVHWASSCAAPSGAPGLAMLLRLQQQGAAGALLQWGRGPHLVQCIKEEQVFKARVIMHACLKSRLDSVPQAATTSCAADEQDQTSIPI